MSIMVKVSGMSQQNTTSGQSLFPCAVAPHPPFWNAVSVVCRMMEDRARVRAPGDGGSAMGVPGSVAPAATATPNETTG